MTKKWGCTHVLHTVNINTGHTLVSDGARTSDPAYIQKYDIFPWYTNNSTVAHIRLLTCVPGIYNYLLVIHYHHSSSIVHYIQICLSIMSTCQSAEVSTGPKRYSTPSVSSISSKVSKRDACSLSPSWKAAERCLINFSGEQVSNAEPPSCKDCIVSCTNFLKSSCGGGGVLS